MLPFPAEQPVSDFCFSWPPGTCLDDSWIQPRKLTPSSPKDLQVQLQFAQTLHEDFVPVVHIEWTLQTDGEWACQRDLWGSGHLQVTPQARPSGSPIRLRSRFPVLCSDTRAQNSAERIHHSFSEYFSRVLDIIPPSFMKGLPSA